MSSNQRGGGRGRDGYYPRVTPPPPSTYTGGERTPGGPSYPPTQTPPPHPPPPRPPLPAPPPRAPLPPPQPRAPLLLPPLQAPTSGRSAAPTTRDGGERQTGYGYPPSGPSAPPRQPPSSAVTSQGSATATSCEITATTAAGSVGGMTTTPAPGSVTGHWTHEEDRHAMLARNRGTGTPRLASQLGRTQEDVDRRHPATRGHTGGRKGRRKDGSSSSGPKNKHDRSPDKDGGGAPQSQRGRTR